MVVFYALFVVVNIVGFRIGDIF